MVLEHFSWSRVFDTQPGSSAAHDVLPPSVQSKCCPGPGGVAPTPAAPNIRRPAAAMLTASPFMESPLVGWLTTVERRAGTVPVGKARVHGSGSYGCDGPFPIIHEPPFAR